MTWTKTGDEFSDECWTLSDAAYRLHHEGLTWSNRKQTEGQLAKDDMRRWARRPEAAEELVNVGWAPREFRQRVFNVTCNKRTDIGAVMHKTAHGSRQLYKRGCRCDLCRSAEREYKKDLRRRQREAVGEFVTPAVTLSLVPGGSGAGYSAPVHTGGAVESAVSLEIEQLVAHPRPGLEAAALALARVLDNPKATSTKPAAAAKLAHLLDTLRKSSVSRPKLASVRRMTKPEIT